MRNDDHMKPRSEQMQIHGLGLKGERNMEAARWWVEEHPSAYAFMVDNARRLSCGGYVSANYLVNMVRNELHIKVENGLAPCFARIIAEEYPELAGAFRFHRSMSDGYAHV